MTRYSRCGSAGASQVAISLGLDEEHKLVSRNAFISLTKITEADFDFEMPTLRQGNDPNGGAGRSSSPESRSGIQEALHYCEKHGVINRPSDLKDQVDQIMRA